MRHAVRTHLLTALEADLVGPFQTDHAEVLPLPPSRWYLTGFLAPQAGRDPEDPTADDEVGAGPDDDEEGTASNEEREPKQKNRYPASMGLSVLLPPGPATDAVRATVRYAEYVSEDAKSEEGKRGKPRWRRFARAPVSLDVPLDPAALARGPRLPDTVGLVLRGKLEETHVPGHGPARALSLFVVNERSAGEKGKEDQEFIFQVSLELEFAGGIVPRPNQRGESARDWDDRVADLQFRERCEHAVGHGVSVEVPQGQERVTRVRTTWLPCAEVRRVVTREEKGVETSMDRLAALADGAAATAALGGLVEAYGTWIRAQRAIPVRGEDRPRTRDLLMKDAERARERMAEGIALLGREPDVLDAFRLANRAMADAARKRRPNDEPGWRLFQLAFVLLNLPSIADERHRDRDDVELIFFPTGGGKTEAYLGVIAFTLLLRRLRGQARPDRGLGVAVLLRYTLRLLTLDQLGRAATLVCALEKLRQAEPARLGDVRFSVGLWVGKSATANTMKEVSDRITEYRSSSSKNAPSPFPLTSCPWCLRPLERTSLTLAPSRTRPTEVVIGCADMRCDFAPARNREGLPVVFVDEQVYRELPSFLIATVDKFAMLPWRGETGMLFGRVDARAGRAFVGPLDAVPKGAERLPEGLRPPELIVQDELHLISGPLGTMVGLYETAIETLCTRTTEGGHAVRPKILASTATVRRADHQVKALFGRPATATTIFPPRGVDDSETFFARVDHDHPGRLYVGVAAPGRAMKAILLRTYAALLSAAQRCWDARGPADQEADGYMTLAGYFNSLRELGGMRRLVEDDVRTRCAKAESRRPLEWTGPHPWSRDRTVQPEPVELTSREPTGRIAASKARLERPHAEKDHVDVLLASNMISVGVDIDRLGLMVVAGQPKTTAEYIQASSRVGRKDRWPGLVVTCFNVHKPRDRSHYERFTAYHESFYRFVEAQSLTPFSGPALERGLAGALVALARLAVPALTAPPAAMDLGAHRKSVEPVVARIAVRAGLVEGERLAESVAARCKNLLDSWERLVDEAKGGAAKRSYSRFDLDRAKMKPFLHTALDDDRPAPGTDEDKFVAPTSMRDVEPSVDLWLDRKRLGGKA